MEMTPAQAYAEWKASGRGRTGRALTHRAAQLYDDDVNDWLAWCTEAGLDPFAIEAADIIDWATTRPGPDGDHSTSRHSYERRLSAVLGFYEWCHENRLVLAVPDLGQHRTGNYDGVPGLYKPTPAEREALSEACAEWTGGRRAPQPERDQLLIRLMLWGLRPRQITAIGLPDVHRDNPSHTTIDLLYPAGDGIDRHHPVPPTVARAIDRYLPVRKGPPDTGPLITSRTGKRLDPNETLPAILRAIAATHPQLHPVAHRLTPDGIAASSPHKPRRRTH